jgi:hypothetical protein
MLVHVDFFTPFWLFLDLLVDDEKSLRTDALFEGEALVVGNETAVTGACCLGGGVAWMCDGGNGAAGGTQDGNGCTLPPTTPVYPPGTEAG